MRRWFPPRKPRGRLDRLVELDTRAFEWVAASRGPLLGRLLPRISLAANNSVLWVAIAAPLAALGGRTGKRAAGRGIGSILLTSLFVNQVVKRLVRRPRPALRHVPAVRRMKVQPLTTSFPSGHAASAAAFATGMAIESRRLGAAVAPLAGAVAYSRVYVGVHYPLDVLAGAAVGAGIAHATRLQFPAVPKEAERLPPAEEVRRLGPDPEGERLAVVVNPGSGSPIGPDLGTKLDFELPRAERIEVGEGEGLGEAMDRAERRAEAIGVAGGDGSVGAGAELAAERGVPLLILPAGTLNHLARDLRIDSAGEAIDAYRAGTAVEIDLGVVDGRTFVNTATFGVYPEMIALRGRLQGVLGRWLAHAIAVGWTALRARTLEVEIDGHPRRIWMAFVGNCRHEPEGFAPSWRPRMDDGLLDVRLLHGERPLARLRLVLSILAGRLSLSAAFERHLVERVEVKSDAERLTLTRDGDTFEGSGSFAIGKRPRCVTAFAPWPKDGSGDVSAGRASESEGDQQEERPMTHHGDESEHRQPDPDREGPTPDSERERLEDEGSERRNDGGAGPPEDIEKDPAYNPEDEGLKGIKGG